MFQKLKFLIIEIFKPFVFQKNFVLKAKKLFFAKLQMEFCLCLKIKIYGKIGFDNLEEFFEDF